jgi:hypothetical protein
LDGLSGFHYTFLGLKNYKKFANFIELTSSQKKDDVSIAEEEDALVLRMEAAMMLADEPNPNDEVEERLSFADSERFDDDDEEQFSAQSSESSSSFSHHWRGWAAAGAASTSGALATSTRDGNVGTGDCQGSFSKNLSLLFLIWPVEIILFLLLKSV